jgi:lipopolysaccharide export system protein LptA
MTMCVRFGVSNLRIPRGRIWVMVIAVALIAAGEAGAQMQGVPNAMQGFSQNRDQQIHIEAASLDVIERRSKRPSAAASRWCRGTPP